MTSTTGCARWTCSPASSNSRSRERTGFWRQTATATVVDCRQSLWLVGLGRRELTRADVLVEPVVHRLGVAPDTDDPVERRFRRHPLRRTERSSRVHALPAEQLDARVIDRVA